MFNDVPSLCDVATAYKELQLFVSPFVFEVMEDVWLETILYGEISNRKCIMFWKVLCCATFISLCERHLLEWKWMKDSVWGDFEFVVAYYDSGANTDEDC